MTAVAVMALVAGRRAQDKPLIEKGRQYLAEHLLDEGEGLKPGDKFYGAIGYGGVLRHSVACNLFVKPTGLHPEPQHRDPAVQWCHLSLR